MKSPSEKRRKILTRAAGAMGLLWLCGTQSYWETRSEAISLALFFVGMMFVTIATVGRLWCALYIAGYKNRQLVTQGPFSLCRHPLYFFSMIGMVGIGCATETFTFPIVFLVLFALYYPFVIKSEERRLKQLFGTEFDEYKRRVSAFIPRFSTFVEPENCSVNPSVYRKHMFSALWFVWIVGILEVIEGVREMGVFTSLWSLY